MRRTTVYLEEEVAAVIRHLAEREGRSQAEIIRVALRRYVEQAGRKAGHHEIPGAGAYRSGCSNVSAEAEELLRRAARKQR